MNKLFRVWRFILPFLFFIVLAHFLKDITQDILSIRTPLDLLGDVKEDVSFLPNSLKNVYFYGLGGLSFLAEGFLLISIPLILKRNSISRHDKYCIAATVYLLLFFVTAILLDPRYRIR